MAMMFLQGQFCGPGDTRVGGQSESYYQWGTVNALTYS